MIAVYSPEYQPTVISGDISLHPPPLHVCISHEINTELRIMYKVSWEGEQLPLLSLAETLQYVDTPCGYYRRLKSHVTAGDLCL